MKTKSDKTKSLQTPIPTTHWEQLETVAREDHGLRNRNELVRKLLTTFLRMETEQQALLLDEGTSLDLARVYRMLEAAQWGNHGLEKKRSQWAALHWLEAERLSGEAPTGMWRLAQHRLAYVLSDAAIAERERATADELIPAEERRKHLNVAIKAMTYAVAFNERGINSITSNSGRQYPSVRAERAIGSTGPTNLPIYLFNKACCLSLLAQYRAELELGVKYVRDMKRREPLVKRRTKRGGYGPAQKAPLDGEEELMRQLLGPFRDAAKDFADSLGDFGSPDTVWQAFVDDEELMFVYRCNTTSVHLRYLDEGLVRKSSGLNLEELLTTILDRATLKDDPDLSLSMTLDSLSEKHSELFAAEDSKPEQAG